MQVTQNVCPYSSTEPRGRVLVDTVQNSEGPSFKSRPRDGDTNRRCGCGRTFDEEQTIQTANIDIIDKCVMSDEALRQLIAVQVTVTIRD